MVQGSFLGTLFNLTLGRGFRDAYMECRLTNGIAWKIVRNISKRLETHVDLLTSPRLIASTLWVNITGKHAFLSVVGEMISSAISKTFPVTFIRGGRILTCRVYATFWTAIFGYIHNSHIQLETLSILLLFLLLTRLCENEAKSSVPPTKTCK